MTPANKMINVWPINITICWYDCTDSPSEFILANIVCRQRFSCTGISFRMNFKRTKSMILTYDIHKVYPTFQKSLWWWNHSICLILETLANSIVATQPRDFNSHQANVCWGNPLRFSLFIPHIKTNSKSNQFKRKRDKIHKLRPLVFWGTN